MNSRFGLSDNWKATSKPPNASWESHEGPKDRDFVNTPSKPTGEIHARRHDSSTTHRLALPTASRNGRSVNMTFGQLSPQHLKATLGDPADAQRKSPSPNRQFDLPIYPPPPKTSHLPLPNSDPIQILPSPIEALPLTLRGMAAEEDHTVQTTHQSSAHMLGPPLLQPPRPSFNISSQPDYSGYYAPPPDRYSDYSLRYNAYRPMPEPAMYSLSAMPNSIPPSPLYSRAPPQPIGNVHPGFTMTCGVSQRPAFYPPPPNMMFPPQMMLPPVLGSLMAMGVKRQGSQPYGIHSSPIHTIPYGHPTPPQIPFLPGTSNQPFGPQIPFRPDMPSPSFPSPHRLRFGRRYPIPELIPSNQSPILEEFRWNKARKWDLKNIFGYINEFSGDQHGSRFIQQKLETASPEERQTVFDEVMAGDPLALVQDVFGNYVIQKMIEYGTSLQRSILTTVMEGNIFRLSLQMYGCRVIQKAVEHISLEQQSLIVAELEPRILECVRDSNGNHVVQRLIEKVPSDRLSFVASFQGNVYDLSRHPYGCRVLQRCLEHLPEEQTRTLVDELHQNAVDLMKDQFGNYVIQFLVEHGQARDRALIVSNLQGKLLPMSRHKFASNVCEKALICADPQTRRALIDEMLAIAPETITPIMTMMQDQFANYVLQRALLVAEGDQREELFNTVRQQLVNTRRVSAVVSKHVVSIERLLEKHLTSKAGSKE